jgi:hypothetical protein
MSQSDFPEHFPFALDASFQLCGPGSACFKPRNVSEAVVFAQSRLSIWVLRVYNSIIRSGKEPVSLSA